MKLQNMRRRLLASSSMICGIAFLGLTASHASAAAADAAASDVSEIVVTGSRIPQPNLTSVSPIQVVDRPGNQAAGQDRRHRPDQQPAAELPERGGGLLRHLQPALQSRRRRPPPTCAAWGPSGPWCWWTAAASASATPTPATRTRRRTSTRSRPRWSSRVEVLTGGASATYGSDAVAGVVNFVMKHNFQGVQIDGQVGIAQHSQNNEQHPGPAERRRTTASAKGDVWDGRSRDCRSLVGTNGRTTG